MATDDHTSKPTRRRKRKASAAPSSAASLAVPPTAAGAAPPPSTPPRTLEEAITNVRILMLQVRAMLHCLSEVLLYSDDDDGVLHAEVAQVAARFISDAAVQMDLVRLRPLIEAIRKSGGGETSSSEDEPSLTQHGPYQVREPAPVYLS